MKPGPPKSPAELVLLSALFVVIAGLIFLIPGSRLVHSPLFGTYLIFCIVAVPICTILPFKFVTDLRHGIKDDDWTEEQLEPLRAYLESGYSTALIIGVPAVFLFLDISINHLGDLGAAWVSLAYWVFYELRVILKRPTRSTPLSSGHDAAPSHSEHWGQR